MYAVSTVEPQWLEHLWNHENMFETGVDRANEYNWLGQAADHACSGCMLYIHEVALLAFLARLDEVQ